jgi:hypothetical protein
MMSGDKNFSFNHDIGSLIHGVIDIFSAVSFALEERGVLQRSEIADALRLIKGDPAPGARTNRTVIAEVMLEYLEAPIAGEQARARFKVVDGDKS